MKLEKANGLVTSEGKLNKDEAVEVEIIGELLPGEIMFNLNHYKGTSHCCETSFRFKHQVRKILNSNKETKEK
jgi:hypothetical protein